MKKGLVAFHLICIIQEDLLEMQSMNGYLNSKNLNLHGDQSQSPNKYIKFRFFFLIFWNKYFGSSFSFHVFQVIPTPVPIPIIPSVNTCMSLTTTTTTNSVTVPLSSANQLQALAEVCSSVQSNDSLIQPTSVSAMNSLASETKVLPLTTVKTVKTSNQEPMDCNLTPSGSPCSPAHASSHVPDVAMADNVSLKYRNSLFCLLVQN